MEEALLKSVILLMLLKFRVCCSPLLEYGLTCEWVNEISMGISTVGFMQRSCLPSPRPIGM